jgi:DNA-binding response OmpR family regulator
MTALHETTEPARFRRFRLIRGDGHRGDQVVADAPPKQVLLSPASARWRDTLADALGPSYRVVTESSGTPAAVVVDSRDDDLVRLIQEQRSATRVIVVHTGHPSEQPMLPSELLDLGADTYLAPASLPALAAHVKALTRSWDAFPPRPTATAS